MNKTKHTSNMQSDGVVAAGNSVLVAEHLSGMLSISAVQMGVNAAASPPATTLGFVEVECSPNAITLC